MFGLVRFIILVAACLTMLAVTGTWLASVLRPPAGPSSTSGDAAIASSASGGSQSTAGAPSASAIPERLRRAKENRDRQMDMALNELSLPAKNLLSSLDAYQRSHMAYQVQVETHRSMDWGRIAAIGGHAPDPPQPPLPQWTDLRTKVECAALEYVAARDRHQSKVEQIEYEYYKQMAEVQGSRGEKPQGEKYVPKTALNPAIEMAERIVPQLESLLRQIDAGNRIDHLIQR